MKCDLTDVIAVSLSQLADVIAITKPLVMLDPIHTHTHTTHTLDNTHNTHARTRAFTHLKVRRTWGTNYLKFEQK